ncbi:MAG: bifunctional hydroxymethylpyrimidine kinase/phosphomethylpyrimidine kinase [Eubacteriales bacterium]|nr:bifunctional hydroxymethylpyrimidine kinase/phosphomethylpyrimidine kinase [Eubacteriales bacterium]
MNAVLSIAGSDCSGGAGIQADLKTIQAMGGYGMTAITALTAQNTIGVQAIYPVTAEFLQQQLDSIFSDIPPQAVKIGMVAVPELIECIAQTLRREKAERIVVDPVMVATSGSSLLEPLAVEVLCRELLPLATVITPNIPEAEVLTGRRIQDAAAMEAAARELHQRFGCAVLCKGGHRIEDANDVLVSASGVRWFTGKRIDNPNTHGTGCTLSSAIAAGLAIGNGLEQAVAEAKAYLEDCLRAGLDLGHGSGPLNHRAGWRPVIDDR